MFKGTLTFLVLLGMILSAYAQPAPQNNQTQTYWAWTKKARAPDLTAASSTSRVALGAAGPVARVCNTGDVDAYVALGAVTVVATLAGSDLVATKTCINLNANGATYIAGITATSTAVVQTTLGTGATR